MVMSSQISKNCAKSALLLGHISSGMGERTLTLKMRTAFEKAGYAVAPLFDICELLGEAYEPLARLNYELADAEMELVEDLHHTLPPLPETDILMILSWSFSLAALCATGIHKTRPTIAKLYAHHPHERLLTPLYQSVDLLITESLLASERALAYGIAPERVLYMPHSYPSLCEKLSPSRTYVEALAESQGKTVSSSTRVIGCVSRFEYGKNCAFAIEGVRRLVAEGEDVLLVLKGDFPREPLYPEFKERFSQMLAAYQHEPWFLWDPRETPFPQVLEEYASFDVLLHPSGAEGGSHVVIECLGLLKPVVVLECSTNPSLFRDLAAFVKTTGVLCPAQLPFYIPDLEDLVRVLKGPLAPPCRKKVEERFHERVAEERVPLLFERDPQRIGELYADDRRCYGF